MTMTQAMMLFVSTFSLCIFLVGCGSSSATPLSLMKELTSVTKESSELLEEVKDKSSAQAAAPKLLASIDVAKKLFKQLDTLETDDVDAWTDPEVAKEMGSRYAQYFLLKEELERIGQIPEAREGLGEAWKRLSAGEMEWRREDKP